MAWGIHFNDMLILWWCVGVRYIYFGNVMVRFMADGAVFLWLVFHFESNHLREYGTAIILPASPSIIIFALLFRYGRFCVQESQSDATSTSSRSVSGCFARKPVRPTEIRPELQMIRSTIFNWLKLVHDNNHNVKPINKGEFNTTYHSSRNTRNFVTLTVSNYSVKLGTISPPRCNILVGCPCFEPCYFIGTFDGTSYQTGEKWIRNLSLGIEKLTSDVHVPCPNFVNIIDW